MTAGVTTTDAMTADVTSTDVTSSAEPARVDAAELVRALSRATGGRPGHRVSHPKGILLAGTFTASARARELTTAVHMQGASVPVTARFSNASTDPHSDDAALGQPRGMSVKFALPDGSETDVVCQSWPVFIVRTPAEFLEFMQAQIAGPEELGAFIGSHPATAAALELVSQVAAPPRSWATFTFHSSVAYVLVDHEGTRRAVRWEFTPEAGEHLLSDAERAAAGPDYLMSEILERLPVRFALRAQLAQIGDPVDDSTARWPADREWVDMGVIELTVQDTVRETGGDVLVMDPTRVTPGIEPSADPILHVRRAAYAVSVAQRSGTAGRD